MTLTIPDISIVALCAAAGATVFAFCCVVLNLWNSEPSEPGDEAQIHLIHERLAHIADSDDSPERRVA
jgi:hypothetical protein